MESHAEYAAERGPVVIVGGGIAGLSAACYLARAGVPVTLYEKSGTLGGRAATQHSDGYCFNRGAHALYTGGAASRILRELGITYTFGIPKSIWVLREGTMHRYPTSLSTLLRTDLFPIGDKLELARLLATLPRLDAQTLATVSVREWLERATRRPRVQEFLAALARTFVYSAALDLVSAEVFVDKLQRSLHHPIHYVDGGWQTLVEGLRRTAERDGARIVSGAGVAAVEHDEGCVRGVRLQSGHTVPAASVILATTPHDAVKLVDAAASPHLHRDVSALVPARIACLDVALRRLPAPTHPIVQDIDRPQFLTAQSVYAHIAPPEAALIHTFKQLDPAYPSDPQEDERELEGFLDAAQSGWRDLLVKRVSLPRIEAVGALPTARAGGFAGRPASALPDLANLYLAGDWVGPEGFLVDASMASARQAAHLVLQQGTEPAMRPAAASVLR